MKKKLQIIGIIIVVLIGSFFGLYKLMNSRTYQVAGTLVNKVETNEKVVYLTFDDGPTKETDRILQALKELDIKATFFLIGSNIEKHTEEAKSILAQGHAIGNHTYSHNRMVFKSPSFIQEEIDKTNDIIKEIGYTDEILFRPPYGKKLVMLPLYLDEVSQTTVMWDIEPESYEEVNKDAKSIANHVIDNVQNGSIILLHPMNDKTDKTIDAIKQIVLTLKEQGYSFEVLPTS
ncbi:polysaccharide deacetylase family protein [Priestia taiwanensis]|uniref:Polysaccharide deacetylase n=1 Tax=Priestia taiwanensis TaxID=1347902 RepID=A0A917ELE7_9BACI|nr:polysaccharide deacetylase family protein [Priestia taiwanensis]MBM7361842.1 chitin deacetylase [Priestia taiwanensis]GGE57358.1 polysaccharide deacetylase [Priestia taiwanensis]